MDKALLFLLVTLIQSQSDGVLLSSTNTNDQMEDLENSGFHYLLEVTKDNQNSSPFRKRALTSDSFTRRSALDKNFMRFGRGDSSCTREPSDKLTFYRLGRGVKDNFIRFGRGRDNFIRFGRSRPDDFFRSGKSLRENFIRFGKADRNFMRFGRDNVDDDNQKDYSSEEAFERRDKSAKDNFVRSGKSGKEGRNGTNFLRFGKSEGADEAEADSSEANRRKREVYFRKESERSSIAKSVDKRGAGFFDEEERILARNLSPISPGNSWQNLGSFRNSRLTPFFPVTSNFQRSMHRPTQGMMAKSELDLTYDLFNQWEEDEISVNEKFEKMKTTESREQLLGSGNDVRGLNHALDSRPENLLTPTEKQFLLYAERGDIATVRRLLEQFRDKPEELNINCVDSLRRSALISAIENENIDLIRLLLEWNIQVKDALLHAIKEEYVEAVELLLEWEEKIHTPGQPYSWEAIDQASATFTPDITPLILAAHMNNYEIIKILLDRGATLPRPHNVRCGCDECIASSEADSLRHSQARINAYKALTASSLIALSSEDPLLTAFELSWELRNLSYCEAEFRAEYNEMRLATQEFATSLLNHARTSSELEEMLNYNPDGDVWEPGERQTLERLKLAIKYKQKKFVAHPNVQQLLASIWYDGLPGFRRKSMVRQIMEVLRLACLFPFYSFIYMMAPNSKMGLFMKKPFVKFIFHSSSYTFFLMLLGLASQRAEHLLIEWTGNEWMQELLREWKRKERGSLPGMVEGALFVYMASLIYCEVRALWTDGLREYIADLWNIVDFITNCFYLIWICLRITAIYIVNRESSLGRDPYLPREEWHPFDPMLLSEGAFSAGMIFSFLKLVHIFSVNPHLGPLQISLGRMIIDILKFFFIYTLVLFAFGCGMNQLMWYYAKLEKAKCYTFSDPDVPDFDNNEKACTVWRRFANLFETSQSLFWASFGLVDLTSFDLAGIKSFTRFWGLLLFGCYSVVNIIVLLNMLIAMMSNSYQIISERSDTEWKFARSHLWMSYFDEGDTLPPPFNLMPTTKTLLRTFGCGKKNSGGSLKVKSRMQAQERHRGVMSNLIARYVTAEQRKRDDYGITEDDVFEIRHDISTLKYELIHILRMNGMKTPETNNQDLGLVTKKGKVMERRLIKDFQIGVVEGILQEALQQDKEEGDVFTKIARVFLRRGSRSGKKKDWNALVRKSSIPRDPIGSTEERKERLMRQSIRRYILDRSANVESLDPEKLLEYNPKLASMIPAARVAYAKFNIKKIRHDYDEEEKVMAKEDAKSKGIEKIDEKSEPTKENETSIRPRPKPRSSSLKIEMPPPSPPKKELPEKSDESKDKTEFGSSLPVTEESLKEVPPLMPPPQVKVDVDAEERKDDMQDEDHEKEKHLKQEDVKRLTPKKPGGKSKVTGEILSGWL